MISKQTIPLAANVNGFLRLELGGNVVGFQKLDGEDDPIRNSGGTVNALDFARAVHELAIPGLTYEPGLPTEPGLYISADARPESAALFKLRPSGEWAVFDTTVGPDTAEDFVRGIARRFGLVRLQVEGGERR